MSTTVETVSAETWRARIAYVHVRLMEIAEAFGEGEMDWAPDVGIDSGRQILWSLAARQRALAARLEGRAATAEPSAAAVRPVEIMALLDATHGRLLDVIDSIEESGRFAEAVYQHLLALTEGATRMRSLLELIDPNRRLPRPVADRLA